MIILGASGHAKVIIEIAQANAMTIDTVYDKDESKVEVLGYPVCHQDVPAQASCLVIAVGNNNIRQQLATNLTTSFCAPLIHPTATVSASATIAEGTVVMAGAVINAGAKIGAHVIINSGAVIEHDCVIDDFVHISPNAALAGNVTVAAGAHVGIGASVIQGISIGRDAVVGAGAAIIEDVRANAVVVGVPGKQIK